MAKLRTKTILRQLQVLAMVIAPSVAIGQSATELKKIFSQAEAYYLYGEYELANQLYILLDTTSNRNLQYKIGVCYLNIPGEKEKSVPYLEAAVRNASYDSKETKFTEKRAPLDSYFYLAKAYMINNELEKGMNTFQTFTRLAGDTKSKGGMQNLGFAEQQIQACNNAISLRQSPNYFTKKLPGQDFSQGSVNENPAVSFDGNTMVFTERRGMVNAIWFSKKIRGVWRTPVEITADLNAGEDCSSCSLNRDGTELFIYKTDDYDGAIYSSKYANDSWKPIVKLNKNINTKFYESHATVSSDGKKLYFTSNREGGSGGLDIYVSEKDNTGDWGPAKNVGPAVNTEYNEDTPFISSNDSLLFFCSEGHQSMGGYDNYVSALKDSSWSAPANLGYPLNTTDDDRFFQPLNNGENGFYSLTTDYKKKDIFYIGFGDIAFELKGTVTLSDTTLIYDENFLVCLTDAETGDTLGKESPEPYSGKYDFRIKPGKYKLKYTGAGYFSSELDTAVNADFPLAEVFIDITLLRDSSAARPEPRIVYEKINLSDIPVISEVDTSMLVRDRNVRDVTETDNEDILYYTVQVIALYNPVNVSYFKHIDDLKIIYNENDKFYRYTTGEFPTREDAYKLRLDLISKGYPMDIFVKKVTQQQTTNPRP